MTGKMYVGDVGTEIHVDIGTQTSLLTSQSFRVVDPNGQVRSWTAAIESETVLVHQVISGELNVAGIWTLQAIVNIGGGHWSGESSQFEVFALGE